MKGYYYRFEAFSIDLRHKEIRHGIHSHLDTDVSTIPDFIGEFLKYVIFIFATDSDVEVIEGGKKNNRPKNDGKVVNGTDISLKVVHSKWNVKTIRTGSFGVSGHFRFQPYGKGLSKVRVRWIDPYTKDGYTREVKNKT